MTTEPLINFLLSRGDVCALMPGDTVRLTTGDATRLMVVVEHSRVGKLPLLTMRRLRWYEYLWRWITVRGTLLGVR